MELKEFNNKESCFSYIETGYGPALSFAHANGFPSGVYKSIHSSLGKSFNVYGLNFCCQTQCFNDCDRRSDVNQWHKIVDELIEYIDTVIKEPVTGVGHSLGGVITTLASIKRPDLFNKIILLDPVFLAPRLLFFAWIATALGQNHRNPLAVRARKRRNHWDSREEAFKHLIDKPLFYGWHEETLRAYTEYGMVETTNGVCLACPPEAEANIFDTYPLDIWKYLKRINVPVKIIRGEKSDVISDRAWELFRKGHPKATMVELNGLGHLFPMQDPEQTVSQILDF